MINRVWTEDQKKKMVETRKSRGWFKNLTVTREKMSVSKRGDKNINFGKELTECHRN